MAKTTLGAFLNSSLIVGVFLVAGCTLSPRAHETDRNQMFGVLTKGEAAPAEVRPIDRTMNPAVERSLEPVTAAKIEKPSATQQKACTAGDQRACLDVALAELRTNKDGKSVTAFCRGVNIDCRLNGKAFPTGKKAVARGLSEPKWSAKEKTMSNGKDAELEVDAY